MEDRILSYNEIKAFFPNEWVLLAIEDARIAALKSGVVLLHSKDYLEIRYKGSEIAKKRLTTIFFTGEKPRHRKWVSLTHLSETPQILYKTIFYGVKIKR